MNSPVRAPRRSSIQALLRAVTLLILASPFQFSRADDWNSPERYVGLSGHTGTYAEVQGELDHLEWQEVRQTTAKPTYSLKQLYEGQMVWRTSLKNIDVLFEYSLERRLETARMIAQKRQKRDVPANFAFEARIAMKGEKRYTLFRDTTSVKPPIAESANRSAKRKVKRFPEFVYAYNGTEMRSFEPFRSIGQIHRARVDAVDSRHMWYFDALSIPTGARALKQSDSVWYVPVALKLSSVYRLLPTLQDADGFRCHVVTSGPDTLWIDTEHGFSLRRRVWFQMTNLAQAPVLAYLYVNKDVRPYADQVWLPNQCFRIDFAGPLEPSNEHGMLTEVHTVTAKTINVNTVADDLFELTFPGGTDVQDLITNKSYIVPHGEHLLDEAIARANPIVNGEVIPFRAEGGSRSVWRPLVILNVVMLLLLAGRLVWRRRQAGVDG
jgi:hypothetical protein